MELQRSGHGKVGSVLWRQCRLGNCDCVALSIQTGRVEAEKEGPGGCSKGAQRAGSQRREYKG